VTITATYSGSKTAVLTVTPNLAFLMNRQEEILASAPRAPEEIGADEAQATEEEEIVTAPTTAPTARTPREKAPAFKLVSLWTLRRSPFEDLFRAGLRLDSNDGPLADDFGGGNGLVAGPFWDLGFGSGMMAARASSARTPLVSTGSRYFFYTPEMNLMAETELTSNSTPTILYEYIWFGGQPVAQVDSSGTTSWTFTDHLGTPLIQTSSVQGITWRAEHEPYGEVFALRTPDQHQPLRLPGQEAEQLNLGPNGVTERSYNILRWYRNGWERYTQADPIFNDTYRIKAVATRLGGVSTYLYANASPLSFVDPSGLCSSCDECPSGLWRYNAFLAFSYGLVLGQSWSYGTYTCLSNEKVELRVRIRCGFVGAFATLGGSITMAGIGAETNPFNAACSCNREGLKGQSSGSLAILGPFSLSQTFNKCSGIDRTLGIAKSVGMGGAYLECTVTSRTTDLGF